MKRHRFDPYSFVFGLGFTVLGLLFYTEVDLSALSGAGWIPLPAAILGLLLLAVGFDRVRTPDVASSASPEPGEPATAVTDDLATEPRPAGTGGEKHSF